MVLLADHAPADFFQFFRAAQHAWRRAAKLHVEFSDRRQIEHGVKGRDFEHADLRHTEQFRGRLDRLLRQPAAGLLLRPPQNRDNGGLLAPFRIFGDLRFRPGQILRRERKARRLLLGKAAYAHRATSPNTISIAPRIAEISASMWPRHRKSMACRWAKPGARILHLYGLLLPSATR